MIHPAQRMSRLHLVATALVILGLLATAAGCTFPKSDATATPVAADSDTTTPGDVAAEAPPAVISIDPPLNGSLFAPMTPIVISAGNGMLTNVVVTGADGVPVLGALSADGKVWQASELLRYGTTYSVAATAANAAGVATMANGAITTVAPDDFVAADILPFGEMTSLGVGMPIVVKFNEDIENRAAVERRLIVTATPPVVGRWHWLPTARCTSVPRSTGCPARTSCSTSASTESMSERTSMAKPTGTWSSTFMIRWLRRWTTAT